MSKPIRLCHLWWLIPMLAGAALVHAQQPVTVQGVVNDRCADATKILVWGLNYPADVGAVELVPADGTKRFYLCSARVQTSDPHPGLALLLGTGTNCVSAPLLVDRIAFPVAGEVVPVQAGSLSGTFAIGAPGAKLCADREATATWIYGYVRYVQE